MMGNIVRVVFFSDQPGEVEKVLRHSTESCSECGAEKSKDLSNNEVREIGREAARAIGTFADGCWYSGLVDELLRLYPDNIIGRVVMHHPETVRSVLLARDIRERHAAD